MCSQPSGDRLAKALEMLREGDTLVVWKLDRLGRLAEMERELTIERTRWTIGLDTQASDFKNASP